MKDWAALYGGSGVYHGANDAWWPAEKIAEIKELRERALSAEAEVRALRETVGELLEIAHDDSFARLVLTAQTILDRHYPEDVFTGSSGDPGPVFVARLREAISVLR